MSLFVLRFCFGFSLWFIRRVWFSCVAGRRRLITVVVAAAAAAAAAVATVTLSAS